jgi:hypothetical protein
MKNHASREKVGRNMLEFNKGEVLVYIPCHSDFVAALSQIKRLREDFEVYSSNSERRFKRLIVILSVNSFVPEISDTDFANNLCDEVIYFGDVLLADVNISQGYLMALRYRPEIFWMLSVNDRIIEGSITRLLFEMECDDGLDLIITTPKRHSEKLPLQDINSVNGVISGVIYRTENLIQFFNVAPFFSWTGWSQLMVVHAALNFHGSLNALFIDQSTIFLQTERSMKTNGAVYAHSFSGDLIQKFLFSKNDSQRRSTLRKFIRSNYYKIHLYSERDKHQRDKSKLVDPEHYLSWNSLISESLLKSYTPIIYLLYKILKKIPFENFAGNNFVRRVKARLHSH